MSDAALVVLEILGSEIESHGEIDECLFPFRIDEVIYAQWHDVPAREVQIVGVFQVNVTDAAIVASVVVDASVVAHAQFERKSVGV